MKLAVIGVGRMGMQIARKLIENDHEVIANDNNRDFVDVAATHGAVAAYTKADVIRSFNGEQIVLWLMIPSDFVDTEMTQWLEVLPQGSIVIDGGNSDFRKTKLRAAQLKNAGVALIDVGTSGGIWGYQNGFSLMAGGEKQTVDTVEPLLKTLSLPTGGYQYFGESGSGHFVKMVHNAIEYGMMESLAEGYRMLKDGPYKELDLTKAATVWQQNSVVTSWLNELSRQALAENPELNGVEGYVAESGEARWALEVAKEMNIDMPAIQSAFDVRLASQKGKVNFATKMLAAMRNKFGGHEINK